jgi:hypothetical protein
VRATFILDGPEPALLEERTVVSLRSDLRELTASLSLPGAERPGVEAVRAEVLRGLRLVRSRRVGTEHVEFRFALPQSLDLGEEYVYEVLFRLPGYRPAPHYAVVPLRPCESADIRVRFPPGCVPEHVWRLDGVPPRVLDDTEPGPDRLRPDPVGEVHVAFRRLVQGLGYGVAWSRRPINESPEQDR